MNVISKVERVTRSVTISHFLLMLGYKLFSFYFPLFLLERGMSVSQVGYTFLLIYLPIALFAPFAGMLNHRVNPALLMVWGIMGYAIYSLGMLVIDQQGLFYAFQVLLGISASLFFVSSRSILMGFVSKKPDRSFGWFYSAPFYTDVLGPVLGAFIIWNFGFSGVFFSSFAVYMSAGIFTLAALRKITQPLQDGAGLGKMFSLYRDSFSLLKMSHSFSLLALTFLALMTGGIYHAFFLLFLRDAGWTQQEILLFGTVTALVFVPVFLFGISLLGRQKSRRNVLQGLFLYSFSSILFGMLGKTIAFIPAILLMVVKDLGSFMANSGRSGSVTHSLAKHPEEAGAIDTIFSPLGQSLGFLIAIFALQNISYSAMFVSGGVLVLVLTLVLGLPNARDLAKVK